MPYDDTQELFYLVDENDRVLGSIKRGEAHADPNKIHRSVGILLIDNDRLLLQQRSIHKDIDPELWSMSVSGPVTFGQEYEEAAKREAEEELGLKKISLKYLGKFLIKTDREKEYSTYFEAHFTEKEKIIPDPTEVQRVEWVPLTQLRQFTQKHQLTSWTLQALRLTEFI